MIILFSVLTLLFYIIKISTGQDPNIFQNFPSYQQNLPQGFPPQGYNNMYPNSLNLNMKFQQPIGGSGVFPQPNNYNPIDQIYIQNPYPLSGYDPNQFVGTNHLQYSQNQQQQQQQYMPNGYPQYLIPQGYAQSQPNYIQPQNYGQQPNMG